MIVEINEKKDLGFKVGDLLCCERTDGQFLYVTDICKYSTVSGISFEDGEVFNCSYLGTYDLHKADKTLTLCSSKYDILRKDSPLKEDGKIYIDIEFSDDRVVLSESDGYTTLSVLSSHLVDLFSPPTDWKKFNGTITLRNEK